MIMQLMGMIMKLMRMMTNYEILAPLNWRPGTFKPPVCQHWGGPASLDGNIKQVAIINRSGYWSVVASIQNLNDSVIYFELLNFYRNSTSAKLVRLALATVRWSVGNGCDGRRRCTSLRWSAITIRMMLVIVMMSPILLHQSEMMAIMVIWSWPWW